MKKPLFPSPYSIMESRENGNNGYSVIVYFKYPCNNLAYGESEGRMITVSSLIVFL